MSGERHLGGTCPSPICQTKHMGKEPTEDSLLQNRAHVYPARIFISEDFPAPLGPIIAVKRPEHKRPDTRFSIVLKPTSIQSTVNLSSAHL